MHYGVHTYVQSNPKLTAARFAYITNRCGDFDLLGRVMPRILVVDDDPMVGATIEVLLLRQGFDVTLTDGGETGLAALEAQAFDVMLVDIFMPHMRGFEDPSASSRACAGDSVDRHVGLRLRLIRLALPGLPPHARWSSAHRAACASRSRPRRC